MVLSNSITAPAATTATRTDDRLYLSTMSMETGRSIDSDALLVAIAAGATDAKYDVNGRRHG